MAGQTGDTEIRTVLICAWCYPLSVQAIQGEEYSHGICDSHKKELLAKLYTQHVYL